MRSKIFYPMVSSRSDGTGLGLSIAQSLINRHRGLIECSSRPGETVFTILLPLENGQ
jgi:two-component system nitrogen regulation sensor histidine kinase GlnL